MAQADIHTCARCGGETSHTDVRHARYDWTPHGLLWTGFGSQDDPRRPDPSPLLDLCPACLKDDETARCILPGNWFVHSTPGRVIDHDWADFATLAIGRQIGAVTARRNEVVFNSTHVPWIPWYHRLGGAYVVGQVWRWRVRYRDTPLYLDQHWDPAMAATLVTLHGLETETRTTVIHRALRGLDLLHILRQQGGRPHDTGNLTEAEFRRLVAEILREDEEAGRRHRTREAWAEALSVSPDTLYRYLRKWPDVLPGR